MSLWEMNQYQSLINTKQEYNSVNFVWPRFTNAILLGRVFAVCLKESPVRAQQPQIQAGQESSQVYSDWGHLL